MLRTPQVLLPPNEARRLETLRAYDILHSFQEPLFAEVVALAATLFNVPISLIGLVAADEVMYKASYGLLGSRSQPRVEAICAMPVKHQQAVVFTDIAHTSDLTPEAATAAQAKGLRFYAGAPLCMPNRHCLGTLCIIDLKPRTFNASEQRLLEQLAHLAGRFIAVRHYCLAGQAKGEGYWGMVQTELMQEMRALLAQIRYIVGYAGTQVPVSSDVLEAADKRLNALGWRLADYYPGLL
ncbi:MAG: GAF domain-containing protein [Hymenobacter sp.]|nr:MAG: GAF domain-containing protein [Hymenobacter sp.]